MGDGCLAPNRRRVRRQGQPVMPARIHILNAGAPLCGFARRPPRYWPLGDIWIRPKDYEVNAAACRDPKHELHAIVKFAMCRGCEAVILTWPASERSGAPPISDEELLDRQMRIDTAGLPLIGVEPTRVEPIGWPRLHVAEVSFSEIEERLLALTDEAADMANAGPTEEFRDGMAALYGLAKVFHDLSRAGKLSELRRQVLNAELDGVLSEFYGLCFQALVAATEAPRMDCIDRALQYLDMADVVAANGIERAIVKGARSALGRIRALIVVHGGPTS